VGRRSDETLDRLAALSGIGPDYYDIWGNKHITTPEAKRAILASMGIKVSEAELQRRLNAKWLRLVEPVMVVSVNAQPSTIPVHLPLEEGRESEVELVVIVEDEAGRETLVEIAGVTATDSTVINNVRYVRAELPNRTDRELGYYEVTVTAKTPSSDISGRMRLIITPDRCYESHGKKWGIYANLYSLRSERNWGVGDLADLGELVRWTGGLGADFVGINPLHSISNRMPFGISPYSSTSRLYSNFIYVDLEKISGSQKYKSFINSPEFKSRIKSLKRKNLIDYVGVASIKMQALKVAFEDFHERHISVGTPEADDFRRYVETEGQSLKGFAAFNAIEEHVRAENPDIYEWKHWPAEYLDHDSPGVAEFVKSHEKEVLFHQYIQWLVDRQLWDVFDEAKSLGMNVGLYQDLAVGSSGGGSDAWSYPEVFAFGMEAGAPPDAFNLNGQAWGFPPLIPEQLRETGYELFIHTIRNNLRYSGALRIDHALGLFRLFWVPQGMSPRKGTYVKYPHEDLLRIIALESVRNEAVIIGEDLGTIGDDVREALLRFGMLSYRLFYFERDWSRGTLLPPEEYPEMALTAVTTHDLPTLRGYWAGRDIEVKKELGLYPDKAIIEKDITERERDRNFIVDALGHCLPEGYSPPENMTQELSVCVHRHLAQTPCRMVVVSLDDVLGVLEQQNMPGTIDQHPNWQQKCPVPLAKVFKNRYARALSKMFKEEGR
jgi:4-alpha-glucanotransferase